ncbi:hypothetical protein BC629DRAFT_1598428 [Irpex lacteus]|nr:hypothetical protein BC629DRAFT_1598428 [Irpex lacteus]
MTEHHPVSPSQDDHRPAHSQSSRIPRPQGGSGGRAANESRHTENHAGQREAHCASTPRYTDALCTLNRATPRQAATSRRRQVPQYDEAPHREHTHGHRDYAEHGVEGDSESEDGDTVIRLGRYVRANLTIDTSRFILDTHLSQGVRVTTRKAGRPVVVVSKTPFVVYDSFPESPDYKPRRGEPVTPTHSSRTMPDAQSLSYAETVYRAPLPDGPNSPAARDSSPSLFRQPTQTKGQLRNGRAGNVSVPQTPTPARMHTPPNTPHRTRRVPYLEPDWSRSGLTAREEITLH